MNCFQANVARALFSRRPAAKTSQGDPMENAVGATNYRASPVSVLLPFHLISFFAFAIASPPLHVHVLLPCSDKLSALFMSAKVDVFIYLFAGAGFEVMAKFVTDSATLERARCFYFYFSRESSAKK